MTEINSTAPGFSLPADDGSTYSLADHQGEKQLLVFYPADNTPVCTRQMCDYRDGIEEFSELGVNVVGISSDGQQSHIKFREKYRLPFTLLSDENLEVAEQYGCKGIMGMKRAVFLVDESGIIQYAHREALSLFRRTAEELIDVIRQLDG